MCPRSQLRRHSQSQVSCWGARSGSHDGAIRWSCRPCFHYHTKSRWISSCHWWCCVSDARISDRTTSHALLLGKRFGCCQMLGPYPVPASCLPWSSAPSQRNLCFLELLHHKLRAIWKWPWSEPRTLREPAGPVVATGVAPSGLMLEWLSRWLLVVALVVAVPNLWWTCQIASSVARDPPLLLELLHVAEHPMCRKGLCRSQLLCGDGLCMLMGGHVHPVGDTRCQRLGHARTPSPAEAVKLELSSPQVEF